MIVKGIFGHTLKDIADIVGIHYIDIGKVVAATRI